MQAISLSPRIARAKNAFIKRKELLTRAFMISLCLKKRIIKTVIWSTLLYGVESGTLKPQSCEMFWRKVSRISWSDKVCNEEVLRRVVEERAIISVINRRQRVWLGHTLRHGDLVRERECWIEWKKVAQLLSGQEASLRSRTIRKDLPLGRTHTHIIIIKERVNREHDLEKNVYGKLQTSDSSWQLRRSGKLKRSR